MQDKKISLDTAIAGWAWAMTVMLMVVLWLTDDLRWGQTAIIVAAVAATATVRVFITQQCISLRNAFELGRDSTEPTRLQRR